MEYVTNQTFFYTVSSVVAITGAVIGYWVKEIKGVSRSFDRHLQEDEKQFAEYRLEVLKMHQAMERHFTDKNNLLEKSIVQIHEHLKYVKDSVDEIKDLSRRK